MIEYFKIALMNLKARKLRSWLTLIGVFVGVAAVVALIGLGDGLRTAITSQIGVTSTEVLTIQAGGIALAGPPGSAVVTPLTEDDVDEISKLSLVDNAISRIIQTGKLEFNDKLIVGLAMTIPDGEKRKFIYDALELEASHGRLLKDGDTSKVVLGHNFNSNSVGLDKQINVGNTVTIQDKKFQVVGIAKKKGSFIFDNIVHMNEEPLKDLFDLNDDVNAIVVKVKSKEVIEQAQQDIERLLRDRRGVKEGEEDFTVETPQALLETLNSILVGVQVFVVIIAGISIIVGGLGIVNTMLTAVLERRSQIGIMKAVGAKNFDIFMIFFFESGLIGFIGGIIGVVIGSIVSYFGTKGINSFVGAEAAPHLSIGLIIGALVGSFLIGSIAGIIPALRAAHQNPVDALRG